MLLPRVRHCAIPCQNSASSPGMKTRSNLARILDSGQFAITAEITAPLNTESHTIRKNITLTKGYVGVFNVAEKQAAVVAMASWALCLAGIQGSLDAIVHMTSRDENGIALQMAILAISAFGVTNML